MFFQGLEVTVPDLLKSLEVMEKLSAIVVIMACVTTCGEFS